MLEIFMSPFGILTKVFHPSICNTIDKNERGFNHFKTEIATTIDSVPCPATISKDAQVTSKRQDTINKENSTFD